MSVPTVTIVTPWWNSPELANGYLAAMGVGQPEDVIVIDNGSLPPLTGPIANHAKLSFRDNRGFAAACNAGLRAAETDAVVFLNNDVLPLGGDWLGPIRALLRPGRFVGPDLRIDPHTAVDGRTLPYIDGWCLAGMRTDLLRLGGFDEDFEEPSYYGDNDLCVRARHAGFKLVQVNISLRHLGNYTSKSMDVTGVSVRNHRRYCEKVRALYAPAAA
ncbi:MAG: glycosyltransferase [Gemmatimonadaceae bacterium]|nr:glycosyltransferase [Gemmatimonadaceae bacterium]